ncbi:MAG: gliding motility-associated ABC transporter substrate-binding protein GldG [Bacteroidia bacterium]|nr:gliding motility-associated ABC transporter substrate-binding protein GldG [Bacteroidia bacterium]
MSRKSSKRNDLIQLFLAVAGLLLLNFLGSQFFFRLDLTEEKRYTLSDQTRELLEELDDVVFFRIYLEGEDFPAGFDRLRTSAREMLDEFRVVSGENIEYEFVDPIAGIAEKEQMDVYRQLYQKGILPAVLEVKDKGATTQKTLFPGAIASFKGREVAVQLFRDEMGVPSEIVLNNSIENLEYELSNAIRKLQSRLKPKIAFLEGHGEWDSLHVADLSTALSEYYVVERIRFNSQLKKLTRAKEYKAIIIARPDTFVSEQDKFILDQYLMDGGKLMFLIDPVYTSMDSLTSAEFTYGLPNKINLDDMLFKYGIRANYNLVQDMNASLVPIPVQGRYQYYPWLFFPLATAGSEHPIVTNLNAVKTEFVSSLDTLVSPGIKKTILLRSGTASKTSNTPVYITLRGITRRPNEKQYRESGIPLAVLLEGRFESLYKFQALGALDSMPGFTRIKDSKPTKVIVIGDGDMIANKIQPSNGMALPLGYDIWTKETFGNKIFLLNAVNYLCDDSGLLSVRSREVVLRMLDTKKVNKERLQWQLINTIIPIGSVLLFGLAMFYLRKRKYNR